ncbi:hypothetical protein O181_062444 [Austropuccinia psidii MF-1]|uniref:Uncharacterized protein n=1 Tax=Austropuccinia psidii MF-1 TaxID=1389203 RepID=A0A9Q3I1K0_9BASI|nr:hypothetical protein [Austropuccinia psidii MF-1]
MLAIILLLIIIHSIDPTILIETSSTNQVNSINHISNQSNPINQSNRSLSTTNYLCRPIGPCLPCTSQELTSPVCEVYHNKRLVNCLDQSSSTILQRSEDIIKASDQNKLDNGLSKVEFQTWEACERVISQERKDYFEFIICNAFIATVSLVTYGFRTKYLVVKQYSNLAARIGILPS